MKMTAAAMLLALTGCASYPTWADLGQMADCGTTYYGIENGYSEGNPLLSGAHPGVICAAKLSLSEVTKHTPKPMCRASQVTLAIAGFSAAAWNVATFAGSGLYALPVVAAIVIFGYGPFMDEAKETCE